MTRGGVVFPAGQKLVVGLAVPEAWRPCAPQRGNPWLVGVLPGPQGAPDYFTTEDVEMVSP